MPRYGYGSDSVEQYGGTAFDPLTGRLSGGQLVMQVLNQIAALKEKKQQGEWDIEDRDLNKRYKEASIRNLDEVRPSPEPKPVSKVSKEMVKSLMKRLDYPGESLLEVDTMNDLALSNTWGKLQDHFKTLQAQGAKIPKTALTPKGKFHAAQLKSALEIVRSRKKVPESSLIQLLGNPEKSMFSEDKINELQGIASELELQEGEIGAMMNTLDENGELSEEQLRDLLLILKWKKRYRSIPKGSPAKEKSKAELEAEKSGVTLDPIK
jgi:hypothetical protein